MLLGGTRKDSCKTYPVVKGKTSSSQLVIFFLREKKESMRENEQVAGLQNFLPCFPDRLLLMMLLFFL
jgi:hypothetical protein